MIRLSKLTSEAAAAAGRPVIRAQRSSLTVWLLELKRYYELFLVPTHTDIMIVCNSVDTSKQKRRHINLEYDKILFLEKNKTLVFKTSASTLT